MPHHLNPRPKMKNPHRFLFRLPLLLLAVLALCTTASAQNTSFWRNVASNAEWANNDGGGINNWYRSGNGWDVRRGDLAQDNWSSSGTKAYNILEFDNATQATTTVNAEGGTKHHVYRILLQKK